ncbi:transposase [Nonomuraea coxensis]|uniref:transposase n=1 Tax=Nonomuraea coxensis TaxID=404386 RepID=UPI001FE939DA|nr:transposase [Nonomuraea coxensis]
MSHGPNERLRHRVAPQNRQALRRDCHSALATQSVAIDATVITAASDKHGAAVTFKKTYGFHPLACWCANTQEALAMLLRPGNAGSNTVADHLRVLTDTLAQIPNSCRPRSSCASTARGPLTTCWFIWKD